MNQISSQGLDLIKEFEGLKLNAYRDSGGIWTVGYGYTGIVNGRKINSETVLTEDRATYYLIKELDSISVNINKLITVKLNQHQYDAIMSFVYNIGINNFKHSTLLYYININEWSLAANEFIKWDKCKGKKIHGLMLRRIKEKRLFTG
ncbi:lysozyme [Salmonella enterica]|nr:lysozyme [Salmonella enterica]EJR3519428.1 lysozyme [Salmonella enterica]